MQTLKALSILVFVAPLSGCVPAGMKEQRDNTQAFIADGQARLAAAHELEQTKMFVVVDELWFCPDEAAARANAECEGGKRYLFNHDVTVIGAGPKDDLWPSEYWDGDGPHHGFVLASAVNELPDLATLDAFAAEVDARYPEARRIPIRTLNFVDLIGSPQAFEGRFLVIRQPSTDLDDMHFADGVFSFVLPIPSMQDGKRSAAPAEFEFANDQVVGEFKAGQRSYRCGPGYCDEFVLVARLDRIIDRTDEHGRLFRVPVFEVVEMADRYGSYGEPR